MSMLQLPDASVCVRLAATMGHFLWQGAAVYLFVIVVSLLLRRSSARARYAAFSAALLVMAVCPAVTFVLLRLPEIPVVSIGAPSPPHQPADLAVSPAEPPASFVGGGQSPRCKSEAAAHPAKPVAGAEPFEAPPEKIDWWRYAPWLVACYLGGTTLMFARLLVALCGGQRLRRRSVPVDDSAILAAFARQARAVGLRFTPAIAFCRDVAVPTVVGVLRPMILLPLATASGLTTDQIEVLLAHELAHIRRYDYLVNVLQRLIEAVLFFHPAVWFISRRIRIEREHCCDDLVLAVGGKRLAYAESLVRMAELSRGTRVPNWAAATALGAVDRPSQLRLRILRLVSGSTGEQVRLFRPGVLGLCVSLMLAAVACVHLASSRTDDRPADAVPPGMAGTWFFENPTGDDEQMAVFLDGRVVVLYSNGHRDETRYVEGTIRLAEYGNAKTTLVLLPDGRTLQASAESSGIAKIWRRIDPTPKTELLRPLNDLPAKPATPQSRSTADADSAGPAAGLAAEPTSPGANQADGSFKLDTPVTIALNMGDEKRPERLGYPVVQFKLVEERLQAVLGVRFSSWPRTKWLMSVELMDAAGKILTHSVALHVTSGTIERVPHIEPAEIRFLFNRQIDPARAARFRFGIQSVSTDQGNPLVFDKELPLELRLSTIESSNAVEARWVRFERNDQRLQATVRLRQSSWPKAKYRTAIEIRDFQDRVVARAEQTVESDGTVVFYGYPVTFGGDKTLRLDLGSTEIVEEAPQPLRYVVWLERVDDQAGAASRPSPAGLHGTVLLPDGKPAIGAQVVLLLAEHEARFVDGRFDREVHKRTEKPLDNVSAVTDAGGHFAFAPTVSGFAVAIRDDKGYAELPVAGLGPSPIVLQPWSRVEGVILGVEKLKTLRPLDFFASSRAYNDRGLDDRGWQSDNAGIDLRCSINADASGRFMIEKAPPGPCRIWREFRWPMGNDGRAVFTVGQMYFETKAGQTTNVTIGTTRRVIGRLAATVGSEFEISPKNTRIHVFLRPPSISMGGERLYAAQGEFLRSDEGKAYSREDIALAADGSFEIEDLAPARYFMQVRVFEQPIEEGKEGRLVGWLARGFDVPALPDEGQSPLLDVGVLKVAPADGTSGTIWGEEIEGVQCRLRKEKSVWPANETPRFLADVRNQGKREFSVTQAQQTCELEVDKVWYAWMGDFGLKSSSLSPGREYKDIAVTLVDRWQTTDGRQPLKLAPGRHTIRVAFIAQPAGRDGGQPVRVVSNPVQIEITPAAAGETTATTGPADASRVIQALQRVPEEHTTTTAPSAAPPGSAARRRMIDQAVGRGGDSEISEAVLKALIAAAGDPKAPNRFRAVYELSDFYWRTAGTRATDALLSALADPNDNTRERAADALGKIGEVRAVEPLVALLHDPNWTVRGRAARALGLIGDARAVGPLLTTLIDDNSSRVRIDATMSLGRIGDMRAVPTLVQVMSDDDKEVRSAAAWSLAQMNWQPADDVGRLRLLVASAEWGEAAKLTQTVKPSGADKGRGMGRLEFEKPILIRLQSPLMTTEWIEFVRMGGQIVAKLHVDYDSGPKARWRATIELLDDSGKRVGQAEATFENSGIVAGVAVHGPAVLRFNLGEVTDIAKDTRFVLSLVETRDEASASKKPDDKAKGPEQAGKELSALPSAGRPAATSTNLRGLIWQITRARDAVADAKRLFPEIAGLGADTVLISNPGYQESAGSDTFKIDPAVTPGREQWLEIFKIARDNGLRVILMPIVLLSRPHGNEWRGVINPPNWDKWFRNYREFLLHFARIAAEGHVEVFMVGSELVSTERYTDRWKEVIREVRSVYPGSLSYSANWDHYKVIEFWDDLDLIGMTSYYKLSSKPNPSLDSLIEAWRPIRRGLLAWQETIGKPLLFTEVGWCSQEGSSIEPWNYCYSQTATAEGLEEQRRCYAAFIKTWDGVPQVGGVIWNGWTTGPGGKDDVTYTPKGKPAERELRAWFRGATGSQSAITDNGPWGEGTVIQPPHDQRMVRVFPFYRANAQEMAQTVRDRLAKQPIQCQVSVDERTNSLVIAAAEKDFRQIADVVTDQDRMTDSAMDRIGKIIRLKHTQAAAVVEAIRMLYPAPASIPSDAAAKESLRHTVTIHQVGDPGETILVQAEPSMAKEIWSLIAELDAAGIPDALPIRLFAVEGTAPEGVAQKLRDLTKDSGIQCRITAYKPTSSLIVQADDAAMERITKLLDSLDLSSESSGETPKQSPSSQPATQPAKRLVFLDAAFVQITGDGHKLDPADVLPLLPPNSTLEQGIKILKGLGEVEVIAHSAFSVGEPESLVKFGEETPYVRAVTTGPDGKPKPETAYWFIGLAASIQAQWLDDGESDRARLLMRFQQTAVTHTEVSAGLTAPIFSKRECKREVTLQEGSSAWVACEDFPMRADEAKKTPKRKGLSTLTVVRLVASHDTQFSASAAGRPTSRPSVPKLPDDIADVPVQDLTAGSNGKMRYFLIGPRSVGPEPKAGYKLVVVMPGGDGGADFNPFVCRIFKNALPAGYIVAQPVALKWTPDQQIVWPTRMDKVAGQQFATEDFVGAVVKDVRSKHKLDNRHVFTLSWSSGGPAAYAVSLAENSPVTGSFVAMSVFEPDQLPSLDRAKGRAYYLYHSPDDRVCAYRMAEKAESMLKDKAAIVALETYPGGHGWRGGNIYGAIRAGITWLEKQTEILPRSAASPG